MQPLPRDPWPSHLPPSFFEALVVDRPDQTAQPMADAALLLPPLLHALPDGLLVLDHTLHCRFANARLQPLLRPPRVWDGIAGLSWHEALDDPWIELLLPWIAAARRGESGHFEHTHAVGDGSTHWQFWLLPGGSDTPAILLLARDQTPQHRHEHELQQRLLQQDAHLARQRARWQALSAGLRDAALFFLDPQGAIEEWPSSAERLLGYAAADVLHSTGPDTPQRPHPLPADVTQALERAALLGQSESLGWLRRADGSRLWAQTVYVSLSTDDGQPLGTACWVRDMTALRQLEDMLRELNQALERKVEERTAQLHALNQDLEAFSYSVSHDLRAPLRHISAYVQLLREDLGEPLPTAVAEDLRVIEEAARHMGQLIDGLLAFARLGRASLQWQPLDMLDLVRASLNRVQHDPTLRRAPDSYTVQLPEQLPSVAGDPLLLSQVWDNLLGNAFKYSRTRAHALITIGGREQTSPSGTPEAHFWVEDNGVGFDPARAERLFGVFQRLHSAREFEGTGIGLALCRRIVERHGGRIWAEALAGTGARFCFALPVAAASAAPPPPAANAP